MIADEYAQRLLASLVPLHAYAARGRGREGLTAFQMNHICEIEAALNAAADLLEVLNPPDTPIMAQARRIIAFYDDKAPLTLAKLRRHFPDGPHPPEHSAQPQRPAPAT